MGLLVGPHQAGLWGAGAQPFCSLNGAGADGPEVADLALGRVERTLEACKVSQDPVRILRAWQIM